MTNSMPEMTPEELKDLEEWKKIALEDIELPSSFEELADDPYPQPSWAESQLTRETGLLEDVCKHGVGHPNRDWLAKHDPDGKYVMDVHGCDGCCSGVGPKS